MSQNSDRTVKGDHLRKKQIHVLATATILALLCAGAFSFFARRTPAQTPVMNVMISDGMKTVVEELTPQIEQATGRKLAAQFNSSKNLRDKIQAGEPFDAAILTSDVLDDLIKQGKIAAGGRAEISRTGIGMGVRAGTTKPDISTAESLRRTLMNAKAISFNPTGASSVHTNDMLMRLGIAQAVKNKLILSAEPGRPQMDVADGKSEVVFSLIPEIKGFSGVDLVGPVPAEFQSYINFAGGISASAHDAAPALALIKFFSSPAVAPVLLAKGMEPKQ
ncbi:MAG TPA: substrate-binding domain-containing protein [Candidatus Saccharimonadales bacterium]|nr:substrate-binding domain-containing protein [Candidatus Saccharimonadales bacterium]